MKIIVKHYWQDFRDEDIYEGEIGVETQTETYEFTHLHDCADTIERDVWWVGDWAGPPETSDGGETIYYSCQWPVGFKVGDPQYRSGSLCIAGASSRVLSALVDRWGVYT